MASTKYAEIGGHTETHFAITGRRELLVWEKKRITAYFDFVSGTPIPDRNCRLNSLLDQDEELHPSSPRLK